MQRGRILFLNKMSAAVEEAAHPLSNRSVTLHLCWPALSNHTRFEAWLILLIP